MAFGLRNSRQEYGLVAIALHWVVALMVFGLFGLGFYMTGLEYTDSWYRRAPWLHKSFGLLTFALVSFRLVWRLTGEKPVMVPMPGWERVAALLAHRVLYLLLFLVPVSGYLISTADGRGIDFFNWFEVPALLSGYDRQEDMAGAVHLFLALAIIGMTGLHTAAALKHHFIDKDSTLLKIFGAGRGESEN